METEVKRCGYAAIIGRPNVGKSTLINEILGQKLSITSSKPQTTRHQILGVKTSDNVQTLYVDTPGIHQKVKRMMNRLMNKAATSVIHDVDVIVFMIDARVWTEEDEYIFNQLKTVKTPVILVLNKIDLIKDKTRLLPKLQGLSQKMPGAEIFPISAEKNLQVKELEEKIAEYLPKSEFLFPKDQLTDKEDNFLFAEIIREKLMRLTGEEIPYDTAVSIEDKKIQEGVLHINVVIWVEREGQKAIVIGKKGAKLKEIGTLARVDLEKMLEIKVFLRLWVKVKEGWSDSKRHLSELGH